MPDPPALSAEMREAAITSLQQSTQGQWPQAAATVRPLADQGDPLATTLAAWFLGQGGQAAEGVPYALKAMAGEFAVGPLAVNYVNWTASDPILRSHTADFFRAAVTAGWAVDPISQAQQLLQQGASEEALQVLTEGRTRTPAQAQEAWESLTAEIAQTKQRVETELQTVAESRAGTLQAMQEHADVIGQERARVQQLVGQTTSLVQNLAADNLAAEYAKRAEAASSRATRWTIATLIVSTAAIVLAAAFVLVGLAKNHDVAAVLSKAAISVPLLALAAYLNRLGQEERRDARSWTHIELQIRTARPYLGNLSDELRDEVQAALALRFFPGQAQDPHGQSNDSNLDDGLKLIREVRSQGASPSQPATSSGGGATGVRGSDSPT